MGSSAPGSIRHTEIGATPSVDSNPAWSMGMSGFGRRSFPLRGIMPGMPSLEEPNAAWSLALAMVARPYFLA